MWRLFVDWALRGVQIKHVKNTYGKPIDYVYNMHKYYISLVCFFFRNWD